MKDHYLTEQHQHALLKVVRHMLSQLNNRQMDTDLPRTTTAVACNPAIAQLEELYEMLNILVGGIETLTNDEQRLANESLQMQMTLPTLTEELSKVKLSIEESNAFFEGIKFDAQSERQTSIYSPPFYSSPNGYKMRARLYLNGDGNARRTYMSLFFVLMRSLNDPILKFPFNYKVTFCLYDQTPAQRHIIDSFRPDIKSSSFQRPRSDMNIASGIPKFFPLETIQQEGNPYVRDDTMFIKIMIDFEELPKTLLPYALSLNPGLPTHIQKAMIKQEAERRTQLRSNEQLQIPEG
ncbi:unnamed protein product [Rotaria sp. Silwood1]|nr:unnamed protein product [Rotaria sp. Silwood1]CAF5032860.1 unnamed protein product [Rotaria sp. Silwood1]